MKQDGLSASELDPTSSDAYISLVLIGDHPALRSGLRLLLEREPDFDVVAEGGDAESAVRYVGGHHPDVVLLDLGPPDVSSPSVLARIHDRSPETKIVVLTATDEPGIAREALQAGVHGYVLEEAGTEELMKAIRLAAAGKRYLEPSLGAQIAAEERNGQLSEREVAVLRLIALGHTNPEIAEKLYLSVRTVETHRAHIQAKSGCTTRSELVRYAIDHSILQL